MDNLSGPNEVNAVTSSSKDATILINKSGVISYMNNSASDMFGINKSAFESSILDVHKIFPNLNIKLLSEGLVITQYGTLNNGDHLPLRISINSFFLNGETYYLLTIILDGEIETHGEKIKPFKELMDLKFALDESTILAITDKKGMITYVNDKFCEISKYTAEELIGNDHRIINSSYHPKEFMQDLWRTISKGEVWRGEIRNRAKDSSIYWVDTTIVPFCDENGKPYQYLAIRKDVTKHKRVVDELKQSVQELMDLKFALDASSIVAITDKRGIIHYVNGQFCRISGYSKEELIGRDHRVVNSGYHSKQFFKEMWQTIASGKVWYGEIKNRAKNGTFYWVDTTIVPFLNEEGKPYQYLAIRHEITNRKKAEEELKNMMTKMMDIQEEERKRISRNLHDGIGQNLYSHLITINRLSSEISHPLLEQMQQEATQLIEEVREISWELRPSVLDDLGLVPAIRSYLARFSNHYNINVHFDCVLEHRLGINQETSIYRIIQEALTNIRKYAQTDEASVTAREMDGMVRVVIADKGKGFELNCLNRGVGLFSMEERARAVNGKLQIQSASGKGTKIILDVPY